MGVHHQIEGRSSERAFARRAFIMLLFLSLEERLLLSLLLCYSCVHQSGHLLLEGHPSEGCPSEQAFVVGRASIRMGICYTIIFVIGRAFVILLFLEGRLEGCPAEGDPPKVVLLFCYFCHQNGVKGKNVEWCPAEGDPT